MKRFSVFGRPSCPYCNKAVEALMKSGAGWSYLDLSHHPHVRQELIEKGFKTVPVIYHGPDLVGGYDDLVEYLKVLRG